MSGEKNGCFTRKEEEFVNLLIEIGTRKTISKILVFLSRTPKATSRTIERGTDMRQSEISTAMKDLTDLGWVTLREGPQEKKGRPASIYELAQPITVIMDVIREEKESTARNQLALIQKLHDFRHERA